MSIKRNASQIPSTGTSTDTIRRAVAELSEGFCPFCQRPVAEAEPPPFMYCGPCDTYWRIWPVSELRDNPREKAEFETLGITHTVENWMGHHWPAGSAARVV